jgi:uncharacterized protein (DUF433 family)
MLSVKLKKSIYGGERPEDIPAYSFQEAAGLVGLPRSTLRSWVQGRSFPRRDGVGRSQAIIPLPKGSVGSFLSFTNVVEVHVLALMRRRYALKLKVIRSAVRYVRDTLRVDHPLATERFKTNGVDLFVERLGQLITASKEGQLGMKDVLEASLERVEYDREGRAVRLFPLFRRSDAPKHIVLDPRRAFGRPVLVGTSVPVIDIRSRFDAGESVDELAADYDVKRDMIEEALRAAPQAA